MKKNKTFLIILLFVVMIITIGCKKSKNGNRPKYNAAVRLLRAGATVETLYGVEYKRPSPPPTAEKSQDQITPTDLSWAFGEAMKLLQEKKAKEQK